MKPLREPVPAIHVWTLKIPPVVENIHQHPLFSLLSRDEQERILNAASEEYQTQYLFSHALARIKIAELFGMPPHDLPLLFVPGAKPRLLSPPLCKGRPGGVERSVGPLPPPTPPYKGGEVHLSLSHTVGLVACAVAPFPVGVDVEPVDRVVPVDDVARRMFHPDEANEVAVLTGDEKKRRFTQYWSLREAFTKAVELSPSDGMKKCFFKIGAGGDVALYSDGLGGASLEDWHFDLCRPGRDHLLALAVSSGGKADIEFHEVGSLLTNSRLVSSP